MVCFEHHPYRFDGRVETAGNGGLCLCMGVEFDYQPLHRRLQSLLPRPQGHAVQVAGPAEAGRDRLSTGRRSTGSATSRPGLTCPSRQPRSQRPASTQAYLRALATLPGFDAYYGVFRSGVKRRPLAEPVPGLPTHVLVRDSEEKGSDVNLATRLLVDGFNREYEQAVVVSNDADFAGAMRYVRDDLGLRVTLVNPDARNVSPRELADAATYVRRLWKSHLRRSLFPDTLTDGIGTITKPAGW